VQLHGHLKKRTLKFKPLYLRNHISYAIKFTGYVAWILAYSVKVWFKFVLPWLKYTVFLGDCFLLAHPVYFDYELVLLLSYYLHLWIESRCHRSRSSELRLGSGIVTVVIVRFYCRVMYGSYFYSVLLCGVFRRNTHTQRAVDMRCHLVLVVHLVVVVLSAGQSSAAASVPRTSNSMSRWCADATMDDLITTSEACQKAETLGGGVECWAYVDAVLQLCLDEAAAAGQLADRRGPSAADDAPLGALKRNRNRFLGKRDGSRNNFLGKRDTGGGGLFRNAIVDQQLAADDDKRSRNKFLGIRA